MKKQKNRSVVYIAVFVGLIMILSVIGFLWSGESGSGYKYNGFGFSYENGKWSTRISNKILSFDYLPEDMENLDVPLEAKEIISNSKLLYITSPENISEETALAKYELMKGLETESRYVVNAVSEENDNGIPVINCENATIFSPVIRIAESNNNGSINLNNNCITLEGKPDLVSERLIYSVYGVME